MKTKSKSMPSTFVQKRVTELQWRKTQVEIAQQAGFKSTNMINILKSGRSKLPLGRVISLARALEADPTHLMRLALLQFDGDQETSDLIAKLGASLVSDNELEWLGTIRSASENTDPILTAAAREGIEKIFMVSS